MNTENNILIAEFLGYEWDNQNEVLTQNKFAIQNSIPKFHSDWNWLMEVVEKIESLSYTIDITYSNVYINHSDDEFKQIVGFSDNYSKIEAVYNACVEFVKRYNGNELSQSDFKKLK